MSPDLRDRFLSNWPSFMSPAGYYAYELPARQRALVNLARAQIESQKSAARTIEQSQLAGARMVAAEIRQQSVQLEEWSRQLASSIADSSHAIESAIDLLGDRLCAYLDDIRWLLEQQNDKLTGILNLLRESRSNEARQLVEQGVRYYAIENYEVAEERFRRALDFDRTDYQVLMNLGRIEVDKGDSEQALANFWLAVRLRPELENAAKRRAHMFIARVHYARANYGQAHALAANAVEAFGDATPDDLYVVATYAGLAGRTNEALDRLERVISVCPEFMSRAAVDPDLGDPSIDVRTLLRTLASKAAARANEAVKEARAMLNGLRERRHVESFHHVVDAAERKLAIAETQIQTGSYSDCLKVIETL